VHRAHPADKLLEDAVTAGIALGFELLEDLLGAVCVFRGLSDSDSDFCRTGFRFLSDSIPISAGHLSDSYRTGFRAAVGQF